MDSASIPSQQHTNNVAISASSGQTRGNDVLAAVQTTAGATIAGTAAHRPPLLDLYKKLLIVFKPTDSVVYEDADGNIKSVPVGYAKLAVASLHLSKPKLNIPVPKIEIVQDYEQNLSPDFIIKPSYVRLTKPTPEELELVVDYTADLEDEHFIAEQQQLLRTTNNNKYYQSTKKKKIEINTNNSKGEDNNVWNKAAATTATRQVELTISLFEQMIDILEKETEFETIIRLDQAEKLLQSKISFFPLSSSIASSSSGSGCCEVMVERVYKYWVNKRCRLRKPLLRKYWPVTAINDTNFHMVFRPLREKEKYKLRKKRQNDMDAFRKMQLLRKDFERIRTILDMILRREMLFQKIVDLRTEIFEQHLYDCCNTSGLPRTTSTSLEFDELQTLFSVTNGSNNNNSYSLLDITTTTANNNSNNTSFKAAKRKRDAAAAVMNGSMTTTANEEHSQNATSNATHMPLFTQPLSTREKMVTCWDNAIPYVPNYVNGKISTLVEFKLRPRLGRGGRLCIDRIPATNNTNTARRIAHYVGCDGPTSSANTLLDLMPPLLDYKKTRMRLAEICAEWSDNEDDDDDDNNPNVELVKVSDWINTDEQPWGEEKLVIGPL